MFCPKCGKPVHESASMCEYCGHTLKSDTVTPKYSPNYQQPAQPSWPQYQNSPVQTNYQQPYQPDPANSAYFTPPVPETPQKKENMVLGILGAIVGAVIGGASIVLLSQVGIVSALSGLLLAICTLKGYELLGGKLSKKGAIICLILMVITPYIANEIDLAISFMKEVDGISFAEAFAALPQLKGDGFSYGFYIYTLESDAYIGNMVMVYIFTILGAFSTVRSAFKK